MKLLLSKHKDSKIAKNCYKLKNYDARNLEFTLYI